MKPVHAFIALTAAARVGETMKPIENVCDADKSALVGAVRTTASLPLLREPSAFTSPGASRVILQGAHAG